MTSSVRGFGKRMVRGLVGALPAGLVRRIQLAQLRRSYLREPRAGPRRLLLEPTTGCNHRCVMCMDHSPRLSHPTPAKYLPSEQIERLLRDVAAMGTEEVWLAGRGEPLLHPSAPEIIRLVEALGMRSFVTTNGTTLTEELSDQLCDWGLCRLSISINAGTPETYARVHNAPAGERARVLGLMRRMANRQGRKPRLMVSIVLSKLNSHELLGFAEDAIGAGANAVTVAGMRPVPFQVSDISLTADDWRRVRRDLAQLSGPASKAGVEVLSDNIPPEPGGTEGSWPYAQMACFIGHVFALVDAEGSVHGCCSCVNRLGSLHEASFGEIWHSQAYRRFRLASRQIAVTGLTPARCECHACGNIADNAAIQQEARFRFGARGEQGRFPSRLDLAAAVWREFCDLLPEAPEGEGFVDVQDGGDKAEAARRLQALKVMEGRVLPEGGRVFEPRRIASRAEVELVVQRALAAMGVGPGEAAELVGQASPAGLRAEEMMLREEVERWLARVRARLLSRLQAGGRVG